MAADGERGGGGGSGQERRGSEEVPPRAADLEEDQFSRFPDAGGGGLEDRACGGRGEGEGRPTRSGREAPFISAGSWIPIQIRGFIFIVEAQATEEKVKSPCLSTWM